MSRPLTTLDFGLFACCLALMFVTLAPAGPEHQLVLVRNGQGHQQQYLVKVADPRLDRWQHQAKQPVLAKSTRALRVARWHRELAEFYAKRTRPKAGSSIQQVSHIADSRSLTTDGDADDLVVQHTYWKSVAANAQSRIDDELASLAQERQRISAPIVELGGTIEGPKSVLVYVLAAGLALAATTMMVISQRFHPPTAIQSPLTATLANGNLPRLRCDIPAEWFRVHQSAAVRLRRLLYGASVVGAAFCMAFSLFSS